MQYSVLGPLMGGFGSQAFLGCEHTQDGRRPVVMVFLPDEVVEKADVFEQILAETEVAAHIDHVNVISVVGLARIDDGYARIVEYADAESLLSIKQRLGEVATDIPLPVAITLVVGACMGVHYAHELGLTEAGTPLIHGAVRPGTLLISYRGVTKVTGYGAAVLAEGLARARGATLSQSDPYTAPEQLLGGRNAATVQTDVYALGAVLYELLVGVAPPRADAPEVERLVAEALLSPLQAERIPPEIASIVQRAMRRRAVERFPTALEMRQALLELGLGASDAEVATFMERLFEPSHPARIARRNLLSGLDRAVPLPSEMLAPRSLADEPAPPPRPAEPPRAPPARPGPPPRPASPAMSPAASTPETPASAMAAPTAHASSPAITAVTPPSFVSPAPERVVYRTHPGLLLGVGLLGGALIAVLVALLLRGGDAAPSQPTAAAVPVETAPRATEPAEPRPTAARREDRREPAREEPRRTASSAKAEPEPRKAPEPAKLSVSTSPELDILVDGKKVGRGSATVTVSPGKHSVRALDRSLGIDVKRRVRVGAGKTERVGIEVGKGSLVLDAPPGCDVFVDGKKVGRTPLGPLSLYEGTRRILVKKGDIDYRHKVPMRAGLQATLSVEFHE